MLYVGCILIVAITVIFTMSMCKAASNADDIMLGDRQYDEN